MCNVDIRTVCTDRLCLTFCPGCSFICPTVAAGPALIAVVTGVTPPPPSWWSPPSEGQVVLTSAPSVERFPKRILGSIAVCLSGRRSCLFGWLVLSMKQLPARVSNYQGHTEEGWLLIDGFGMTPVQLPCLASCISGWHEPIQHSVYSGACLFPKWGVKFRPHGQCCDSLLLQNTAVIYSQAQGGGGQIWRADCPYPVTH